MSKQRYIILRGGSHTWEAGDDSSNIPVTWEWVENGKKEYSQYGTEIQDILNSFAERSYRLKFIKGDYLILELCHCPLCALAE